MTYFEIALVIIGSISFFQYRELNNNNIRHDERIYAIIMWICLALLLTSLLIK